MTNHCVFIQRIFLTTYCKLGLGNSEQNRKCSELTMQSEAEEFGNWPRVRPTPEVLSQIQTSSRAHVLTATFPHHQRLRTGGSQQIHPREGLKHPDL